MTGRAELARLFIFVISRPSCSFFYISASISLSRRGRAAGRAARPGAGARGRGRYVNVAVWAVGEGRRISLFSRVTYVSLVSSRRCSRRASTVRPVDRPDPRLDGGSSCSRPFGLSFKFGILPSRRALPKNSRIQLPGGGRDQSELKNRTQNCRASLRCARARAGVRSAPRRAIYIAHRHSVTSTPRYFPASIFIIGMISPGYILVPVNWIRTMIRHASVRTPDCRSEHVHARL